MTREESSWRYFAAGADQISVKHTVSSPREKSARDPWRLFTPPILLLLLGGIHCGAAQILSALSAHPAKYILFLAALEANSRGARGPLKAPVPNIVGRFSPAAPRSLAPGP